MNSTKPPRGRPKGTGLNDFAQLKAIAGLLTADPDLRPTTAIRRLGFQDPSVIRRLRDKFNACQAELMAELQGATGAPIRVFSSENGDEAGDETPAQPVISSLEASRTPGRAIALAACDTPRITQPITVPALRPTVSVKPAPTGAAAAPVAAVHVTPKEPRERAPRAIPLPSETSLPEWIGVGLSVYVMSMEAQFAVIGTLFEWPPLAAVLRSQIAFAEMAVASTRPGLGLGLAGQVRP